MRGLKPIVQNLNVGKKAEPIRAPSIFPCASSPFNLRDTHPQDGLEERRESVDGTVCDCVERLGVVNRLDGAARQKDGRIPC